MEKEGLGTDLEAFGFEVGARKSGLGSPPAINWDPGKVIASQPVSSSIN